jgi:hypothetical protein
VVQALYELKDLQFYADELAKSQRVSCSGFKPYSMMIINKVRIKLKPLEELLIRRDLNLYQD